MITINIKGHDFLITKYLDGQQFRWHDWKKQDMLIPTLRLRLHKDLGFFIQEVMGRYVLTLRYRVDGSKDWLIGWETDSYKTVQFAKFNAHHIWNAYLETQKQGNMV